MFDVERWLLEPPAHSHSPTPTLPPAPRCSASVQVGREPPGAPCLRCWMLDVRCSMFCPSSTFCFPPPRWVQLCVLLASVLQKGGAASPLWPRRSISAKAGWRALQRAAIHLGGSPHFPAAFRVNSRRLAVQPVLNRDVECFWVFGGPPSRWGGAPCLRCWMLDVRCSMFCPSSTFCFPLSALSF
jgi:hypothetical protein